MAAVRESLWVVPDSVGRSRDVKDPTAALRELGATMVVQGSVRRKGSGVQLTVALIDSKRLRQIGSAELEDRTGDLATLQNQAVAGLARMMRVKSSEAAQTRGGSVAPGTYEPYLKALAYLQRYGKTGNTDLA